MGFGDLLMSAGQAAMKSLQEKSEKIEHYRQRYEFEDTDVLIRRYKSNWNTQEERIALLQILKERGCTRSDIE